MFFNSFQEIVEGDCSGRNVLIGIVKRMNVPTDEGVIGAKDSCRFLYKSVRAFPCIRVVEDVDEGIVGQDDPNLHYSIIQNPNVVGCNQVRPIAGILYGAGECNWAQVSH